MSISPYPLIPGTRVENVRTGTKINGKFLCQIEPTITKQLQLLGSYQSGEDFTRDPVTKKGNSIDALPYWSQKTTVVPVLGEMIKTRTSKYVHTHPNLLGLNCCDGLNKFATTKATWPVGSFTIPISYPSALPSFSQSDEHFARKVAETKAVNKLRRGVANIPMIWMERTQTLESMKTRISNLVDIAVNRQKADLAGYRKIKGKNAKKRFAKKVANDHLEMIFGWAPLLDDLEGLVEYINEPRFDFVRGTGNQTVFKPVSTKSGIVYNPSDKFLPDYAYVQKTYEGIGYRCALRADVTSALSNNMRKIGFQPVYTAYDSIPLSFVLGWFSNFGSWIGTFDPLYGANFRTGSVSRKVTRETEYRAYGIDSKDRNDPNRVFEKTEGRMVGSVIQDHRIRTVLTAEPDAELFFQNNFSTYAVLASISLAVQKKLKISHPAFKRSPFVLKGKKRRTQNLPPIQYRPSSGEIG